MPRTISDTERRDLRKRLLSGIQQIIAGNPGNTLGGQPVSSFLAGAAPGDPFGNWQHRAGRATCDRWARGERAAIFPGRDVYYRNLCTEYLGSGVPGDPSYLPPFSGGQCSGQYRVEGTATYSCPTIAGSPMQWISGLINGPITGIVQQGNGQLILIGNQAGQTVQIVEKNFGGQGLVFRPINSAQCGALDQFRQIHALSITALIPIGFTDNCGDPESEFDEGTKNPTPDPNPGPVGGPTGYPFPGFDITINPDGTITIDFGDGEPVTIDPGTGVETGGGDGVPGPGDIGDPGSSDDSGAGGEAEGEAPEGSVLVGLDIEILAQPPTAKTFSGDVFRAIGYIYMGVPGNLALHPSGSTHREKQFTFAEKDNLTAWKVIANSGYNLRVTPYFREV